MLMTAMNRHCLMIMIINPYNCIQKHSTNVQMIPLVLPKQICIILFSYVMRTKHKAWF